MTGAIPLDGGLREEGISQGNDEQITHLVEAQVEGEDIDEAIKIVSEKNGFKLEK